MRPTARPITAPTSTSIGVWPSSSRSLASWTPRMWTRSSTRRFRTSACRPAARRRPAASYITTKVKIRAIAKGAEVSPAYLPMAAVRPITIALWLLGMPPVSASTRRLSLRWRTDVSVTLAAWQIVQATIGASRYFTAAIVRRGRQPAPSKLRGAPAPGPADARRAGARRPARRAERCRRQGARSSARGLQAAPRRWARPARSTHGRGDATKNAVDETAGFVSRERLGQLDRLVDRGFRRHAPVDRDLVDGDPQHHALNLRHLLEPPVVGRFAEDRVQLFLVGHDSAHELTRESRDIRCRRTLGGVIRQHLLGIVIGAFELKQDLQRQLPGLMALAQGRLVGEGDAEDEDVDLTDLEAKHPLGRLDDIGLDRARNLRQLRVKINGDEHLKINGSIGFDLHAHAAMGRLPSHPVSEVSRRRLVHPRHALHFAGGECCDAGDDFVGHADCTRCAVAAHRAG